jgi:hypothetical protein
MSVFQDSRLHRLYLFLLGILVSLPTPLLAQKPAKSRLDGYVGGPYKVIAADFTGDKFIDVILGYHAIGVLAVEQGDGSGNFSLLARNVFSDEHRTLNPDDATWSIPHVHNMAYGDVDGDGKLDLVFAVGGENQVKPGRVVIVRNDGQGRFTRMIEYATPSEAKGVRLADMNHDGKLDVLYTARGSGYESDLTVGRLYIRAGQGGWKFGPAIESPAGRSAYYIELADLDNDGFLDILIPNEHDSCVTYFINPGKALFTENRPLPPHKVIATQIPNRRSHAINDVRAADFNADGNQDLVTANLGTSTVSIFPGNGDGTFQKDMILEAGKNGAFLATADFDSDGDTDFVITHWTEDFASVFLNRGDGTFAERKDYKTGLGNYGVDVGDLNGDGHPDIVTANYRDRSMSLLFGIGNGDFKDTVTTSKSLRSVQGKWVPETP